MRALKIIPQITNRESSTSFSRYLQDVTAVSKGGVLTKEQELVLLKKIKEGDVKAEKELVEKNLRFVVSVAKQYHVLGCELDDLINEGNFGLVKAARKFDVDSGNKFISYAIWWIRQYIFQYFNENSRTIRIPTNKLLEIHKINKQKEKMEQTAKRDVSIEEFLENYEGTDNVSKISSYIPLYRGVESLNMTVSNDGDSTATLEDFIPSGETTFEEDASNDAHLKHVVSSLLNRLPARRRLMLEFYYGLNGKEVKTTEEIAQYFDLKPQRVMQLKNHSLRILKTKKTLKNRL